MLHVFVDEAGVLGTTHNFIIGFTFFLDKNYKICVDNTISKIKALKGDELKELHFHDMSPEIKIGFLKELNGLGGKFGYIHVQRDRINEGFQKHPDNNLMYNLILFYFSSK